jgi:hypothetical protein
MEELSELYCRGCEFVNYIVAGASLYDHLLNGTELSVPPPFNENSRKKANLIAFEKHLLYSRELFAQTVGVAVVLGERAEQTPQIKVLREMHEMLGNP